MHLATTAIVCAILPHGEHGAIARLLTPADGLMPGFVRGGRSRRVKPVLIPGNIVQADFRARTADQLAQLSVELVESRAPLLGEPLAAAAIDWATALAAATLPDGQPYPRLHAALDGLLAAIAAAPSARGWTAALVRFELLLLAELGFGLDLSACTVTGARDDLAYVSPKSGAAISRETAAGYEVRLLALPRFLVDNAPADWPDMLAGLALTGHFLDRDVLTDRRASIRPARERLVERLKRAAG